MNGNIQIFNYNNNKIRTVIKDGEAWFVAKDVCDILGLKDVNRSTSKLDDDEKGTQSLSTPGGMQNMTTINESGLYTLILRSYKPEAKNFRRWVTHDVLPDIRKHGMYISDKLREAAQVDKEAFDAVVNKYLAEKEKVKALEAQIDADRGYTNLGKVVLALPGSVTVAEIAQMCAQHGYDIGSIRLYRLYRDLGLLCSQKKRKNKPTQKGIESGIVNLQLNQNGEFVFSTRAMVTPEGFKKTLEILQKMQRPLEALWENEAV